MLHIALVETHKQVAHKMFNCSEIFRKAWADYRIRRLGVFAAGDENGRQFIRAIFAKALTDAWAEAKAKAADALRAQETEETARRFVAAQHRSRVAVCAAWTPQQRSARIAAIRDELAHLDYAPWGIRVSDERATLNDELAAIEAASAPIPTELAA